MTSQETESVATNNNGPAASVNVKIGEILVEASIVSSAEMTEAVQVSKRLGVPIGRVLTMSGCVREDVMEAALHIQKLMRDGNLSYDGGLETIKRVHEMRIELSEALSNETLKMGLLDSAENLGELLLDSNIISEEDLVKAMQTSFDDGVPLGTTLVLQGLLSPSLFPSILSVQKNIARGITGRTEGIKEIQDIFMLWLKAEESLRMSIPRDLASDAISRTQDLPAIDKRELDRELKKDKEEAKAKSAEGEYKENKAVQPAPPVERRPEDMRLVDLLKQSGVFSQAQVQKAYEALLRDPERSGKFFVELGLIGPDELKICLRSHNLLVKGNLTKDEAIYAVRNDKVTDFEREITDVKEEKVKRYMDKQWRGKMSTVVGGALIGAVVAGFSLANKKNKP